jgi:hypothetical protein
MYWVHVPQVRLTRPPSSSPFPGILPCILPCLPHASYALPFRVLGHVCGLPSCSRDEGDVCHSESTTGRPVPVRVIFCDIRRPSQFQCGRGTTARTRCSGHFPSCVSSFFRSRATFRSLFCVLSLPAQLSYAASSMPPLFPVTDASEGIAIVARAFEMRRVGFVSIRD